MKEKEITYELFPVNLKKLRKELGITQEEMAQLLNTTKTTVFRYEKGEVNPGLKTLQTLNRELNINLNWLVSGKNDDNMFLEKEKPPRDLAIDDLFPGVPPEKDVIALVKGLEVPIIRYSLIVKFLEYQKEYDSFIQTHYQEGTTGPEEIN